MLGHKKDKTAHFLGSKYNQSHHGVGHKKFPVSNASGNNFTNNTNVIEQHKQLDENVPTGLNLRKNQSKKSGIERKIK
jgi:hypothetical protein